MKSKKTIYLLQSGIALAALTVALAGCGGSSGGNGEVTTPDNSTGSGTTSPETNSINIPDYVQGTLNEATLDSVALSSYFALNEIVRSNVSYLEFIEPVAESDLGSPISQSSINFGSALCPLGGTQSIIFDYGRPRQTSESVLVFSAGNTFTFSYESCKIEGSQGVLIQEGSTTATVETGYYDSFDEFLSLSGSISLEHRSVGIHDGSQTLAYTDGDITRSIQNGSDVSINGTSLKVKPPRYSAPGYALENYTLKIEETGASPYIREWTMNAPEAFGLGLGETGELFQTIISDLIYSESGSELTAGSYSLKTPERTLEITIEDGFLSYEADLDGDNVSDISATVNL
ncbi:hypothetical protein [Marinobacter sp. S6332]|uniref:hypothetical protein n=1 Tax=Marinobacter sp. S6332 TaxID=2926403 RepID=UPI001FF50555|nr:hypothetical protein [Marinobacter sp. S6332]MCK0164744.1 hypothetical protein [Marinobacter sp. S6332]